MKSVLVDASPILESYWTGIPVFTSRLLQLVLTDPDIDSAFMIHGRLVKRSSVVQALALRTGVYLRGAYEQGDGIDRSMTRSFEKVLYPSVKTAFQFAPREASVVHDLTTIMTPEFHVDSNISFHRDNIAREIDTNEITFATSEATASDLYYYLGVARTKIRVAYQFVQWPEEYELVYRSRYPAQITLPYVLVIGTIEPRKNLNLVFAALDEILKIDHDLQVVVLGKPGWHLDQLRARDMQRFVDSGRLRFTGFVSELKKYCLLRLCRFTVFPSLIEGFGIPVLESLSVGRPVLASFSSSIPEVAQGAAVYFDPLSRKDFIRAFKEIYIKTSSNPAPLTQVEALIASKFTRKRFFEPFRQWILSD